LGSQNSRQGWLASKALREVGGGIFPGKQPAERAWRHTALAADRTVPVLRRGTNSKMANTSLPSSPRLPALVICAAATGGLRVAAMTLLDRLLVAVHRAGAGPITVVCVGDLPPLTRAPALGVKFEVVRQAPVCTAPMLVATTSQLVSTADVRQVIRLGGRLVSTQGVPLPIGVTQGGFSSVESAWAALPSVPAGAASLPVGNAAEAQTAERALWASLSSSADGFVDRWFNRPVGRWLSKLIVHTPITPNQVSLTAIALGVVAGGLFGRGELRWSVTAAVLFQISAIIDCVDGDVARAVFKESPVGKWLDLIGDQVVHAAVFAGIAVGLWRSGAPGPFLWLGGSAVLGGLIAFGVVVRGMKSKGEPNRRLQQLIDGATSRDFSVLVLALAVANRLPWFLWLAALGSHVFWLTALTLQLFPGKPARSGT
jgi:phosphatidylglycerophosphate synthase